MIDVEQLKRDAENGDAEAQFMLGSFYNEGTLLAKDREKGIFWFEKAAAAGNVNAMINCNIRWSYQVKDEHKNHIGRLWGMAAAATSDSIAQYNYAVTFQNGEYGQADIRRAIRFYRLSARQGNADAKCNLARAIIEGDGVKQDIVKGVELLNEALDQDNAMALYIAGHYLLEGDIVEQDIDLAYEYFVESSKQGLWLADEVLEDWDEYTEAC